MKPIFMTLCLFFSLNTFSSTLKRPANPFISNKKFQGVYVDFKKALYRIKYDLKSQKAFASTTIHFTSLEKGYPLFDVVNRPEKITLNGLPVQAIKLSPDEVTTFRFLDRVVEPGDHTLELTTALSSLLTMDTANGFFKNAFWMSDLSDRSFLEKHLPTSFEYDQYKIDFDVQVIGATKEHEIFSNGSLTQVSKNHFRLSFPKHFGPSALFYHITPKKSFKSISFSFLSIDGRKLPVTIYSRGNLKSYQDKTIAVIRELERDYGPWPHQAVLIYGAGRGGMEYFGATRTSYNALGHELTHSYFARGTMPARGNSGWIDEAIASWRDKRYPSYSLGNLVRTSMAGHSQYTRKTDQAAYSKGMRFMGYLHFKFSAQGGLKPFLRLWVKKHMFSPYLTEDYQMDLEDFFSVHLGGLFEKYVYGDSASHSKIPYTSNPMHPKLSIEEEKSLL